MVTGAHCTDEGHSYCSPKALLTATEERMIEIRKKRKRGDDRRVAR